MSEGKPHASTVLYIHRRVIKSGGKIYHMHLRNFTYLNVFRAMLHHTSHIHTNKLPNYLRDFHLHVFIEIIMIYYAGFAIIATTVFRALMYIFLLYYLLMLLPFYSSSFIKKQNKENVSNFLLVNIQIKVINSRNF